MSEELRERLAKVIDDALNRCECCDCSADYDAAADAAIAYIRQHDGHAEFVRAVWSLLNKATHELNTSKEVEADNAIWDGIRLCDDELAKEQNNG